MKKLIQDLLTSPANGKFSRKSFILIVTFLFILLIGAYIVFSDRFLEKEINRYSVDIFNSLLLFETALLGIAVTDKKLENKSPSPPEEENTDI